MSVQKKRNRLTPEQIIDREARRTMKALAGGRRLPPIVFKGVVYIETVPVMVYSDSANFQAAGQRLFPAPCRHRFQMWTDKMAVCRDCGEAYDCEKL